MILSFRLFSFIYYYKISNIVVCVCLVAQSYLTLCDPIDCSPPDLTVHGILQAKILEWVAIPFCRESSCFIQ